MQRKKLFLLIILITVLGVFAIAGPSAGQPPPDDQCLDRTVVDFDNPVANPPLNGVYGGIDWGTRQWQVDTFPCGDCEPRLAYFRCRSGNCSAAMCRQYSYEDESILESLSASAHFGSGVMDIVSYDAGGAPLEVAAGLVRRRECATYETGFTLPAATVEICYEHGWALGVDNLQSASVVPDGTACDDGDSDTENDVCTAGQCAGEAVVTCPCWTEEEMDQLGATAFDCSDNFFGPDSFETFILGDGNARAFFQTEFFSFCEFEPLGVLIFGPGSEEIDSCRQSILAECDARGLTY